MDRRQNMYYQQLNNYIIQIKCKEEQTLLLTYAISNYY